MMDYDQSLEEWAKDKPLSILQLDPADRAVLRIADERDAIQKKTFTKWVNKHLTKTYTCLHVCAGSCSCDSFACGKRVGDLFEDLRDGHNLVSLLEVLSGDHLPRERGRMRFHMLQNVQTVLDFLRYRKIKLVNIRAEDIVDGNPKLTLGLIWTIILHFQISDIVVGMEENVSAKDALLKWAQRTTAKYPGVRVDNFTGCWRDGLAFNAIIHRNRPDLIDWRSIQRRNARDRLETAFSVAERDCGVTRLLDVEDVDTPQPDEKSLITYISSLYDAFPEAPRLHPLHTDSQKKWEEYREIASNLYTWTRQHTAIMQDRHFSSSLIEMRKMAAEMNRFRVEEVPPRAHDKQRLAYIFNKDLEKHFRDGEIDRELHLDNIERSWQLLMLSHQEKDQAIHDEIKKLEKLQRIAEKLQREVRQVETRLDEVEQRIEEEARRIDRLHPLDAKHNCDQLEREMQLTEDTIKSMFTDSQALRDARYHQATDLHKMVQQLHQRWINVRTLLHNRLLSKLASISFPIEEKTVTRMSKTVLETRLVETNQHFRVMQEVSDWIRNKHKQLQDSDYGSDLPSVQAELEKQLKEHKSIDKFQTSIEKCSSAKHSFHGDELQLYINYLNGVQKAYADLLMSSKKRQSDLETLMDFVQSATNELIWLSEKEEREITRDWSSKNLNLVEVEQYYENLMSELEKREIQFNAVQDRGESLVLQHHPASKCIETYMSAMQTQWSWLLQLTLCLETHLKYVATYQQYFADVRECEQQVARKEEMLNSIFSKSDFSLDEGEVLLKDMQDMRDELTKYGDFIQGLTNQSREIIPLKQRKTNVTRPTSVTSICNYKQNNQQMVISKDERCTLHDNSQRVRWRVTNSSGLEGMVPGVCFLIPPPDKEALDAVDRIRRQYDRTVTLWQKKQLKMRQNMIFATIKVVKSWDLSQFLAMGSEQRSAIRKALNEDAEKLIQEGDPNDPALKRLRREIDEVNRLFDEFEKKASDAEKTKHTTKNFAEQVQTLQSDLDDTERLLLNRVNAPVPRDIDSIERLVVDHKEFEIRHLQSLETRVESVQRMYSSIQKTSALQSKLDKVVDKWQKIWGMSHLYVESLKCVEIVITTLEETTTFVSQYEMKLSSYDSLSTDDDSLKRVRDNLSSMSTSVHTQQHTVDQLVEDTKNVRRVVEKLRPSQKRHTDVERLEDEVSRTTTRFKNLRQEMSELERITSGAEKSKYNSSYQTEMNWLDNVDTKTKSLPLVEGGGAKRKLHPHMTLYNSVIEEKIIIEEINTSGARLAKEAKTFDITLEKFRQSLSDIHPSLDGSQNIKQGKILSGEEVIFQELDLLNLKYQLLVDNLYHKLQQLTIIARQEDPTFEPSPVPAPTVLRTYRMHLPSHEASSPIREILGSQGDDVVDFVSVKSTANVSLSPVSVPTPKKRSITPIKNGDSHENGNGELKRPFQSSLHFSEIVGRARSGKRIERMEEGISTETATTVPAILDPSTGELLTLAQAIGCGIIDIKSGMFHDPKTNQKMTLQEAAELGYIEPTILHKLLGVCGLVDPQTGQDLTLLDVIRSGLYDLSRGGTFIDPQTGAPITTEQAIRLSITQRASVEESIRQANEKVSSTPDESSKETVSLLPFNSDPSSSSNVISTSTFSLPSGAPLLVDLIKKPCNLVIDLQTGRISNSIDVSEPSKSLPGAYNEGLITIETLEVSKQGSSLSDLLDQGLVSHNPSTYPQHSIRVQDRFSGKSLAVNEAVEKGILNPHLTEVFNPLKSVRVSVHEAIDNNLLDENNGLWDGQLSLPKSHESLLIMKPLSLRDCCELNVIKEEDEDSTEKSTTTTPTANTSSIFIDPITNRNLTVLEAIQSGLLDVHSKTISDTSEVKLINLQEALVRGIVTPENCLVKDTRVNEWNTVRQAAAKGLLSSVKRTSIFSIPCVLDSSTKEFVSLSTAVEMKIINPDSGTIKDAEGNDISFQEAAERQLINPQVYPTLQTDSGFFQTVKSKSTKSKKRPKKELSVYEAVITNTILPTGEVVDAQTKLYCPLDVAVAKGSLDPDKADFLRGLYNINLTTASVTTTIRHRITVHKKDLASQQEQEPTINFQDALVQGYIDNTTGFFTNPTTGQVSTIEEAVIAGTLTLNEEPKEGVKQATLELIPGMSPPTIVSAIHKISTPEESLQVNYSNRILPSLTTKNESEKLEPTDTTQIEKTQITPIELNISTSSPVSTSRPDESSGTPMDISESPDLHEKSVPVNEPAQSPNVTIDVKDLKPQAQDTHKETEGEPMEITDSQSSKPTTLVSEKTQDSQVPTTKLIDEELKKSTESTVDVSTKTLLVETKPNVLVQEKILIEDSVTPVEEKQEILVQVTPDKSVIDEVPGQNKDEPMEISDDDEIKDKVMPVEEIHETLAEKESSPALDVEKSKEKVILDAQKPKQVEAEVAATPTEKPVDKTKEKSKENEPKSVDGPSATTTEKPADKSKEKSKENEPKSVDGPSATTTEKPADKSKEKSKENESKSVDVPSTATTTYESKLQQDIPQGSQDLELLTAAVWEGKIDPQDVKIIDPSNGKEMNMNEAINKGIVDKSTGEVKTSSGKKMSFADALKIGAISLAAAPLALVAAPIVGAKMLADKVTDSLKKKEKADETPETKLPTDSIPVDKSIKAPAAPDVHTIKTLPLVVNVDIQKSEEQVSKQPETGSSQSTDVDLPIVKAEATTVEKISTTPTDSISTDTTKEIGLPLKTEATDLKPVVESSQVDEEKQDQPSSDAPGVTKEESDSGKIVESVPKDVKLTTSDETEKVGGVNDTMGQKKDESSPSTEPTTIETTKLEEINQALPVHTPAKPADENTQESLPKTDIIPTVEHAEETVKSKDALVATPKEEKVATEEKKGESLPVSQPVTEALSMELLHVPTNGWQLLETIEKGLLDPIQGLLTIPGTDRMVSFEECIHMKIIDPSSAEVIQSSTGKRLTLVKALEKQILDGTGHYSGKPEEEKLNLKNAIEQGYIVVPTEEVESNKHVQSTPTPATATTTTTAPVCESPETLTVTTVLEGTSETVPAIEPENSQQAKLEISPGIIFDPNTGTIMDEDKNEEVDLLTAILEGKIKPTKVKVRDPASGKEININEAIRKGMVDKSTGKVKVKSGPAMTLLDAVKLGTVAVVATPLTPVEKVPPTVESLEGESHVGPVVEGDKEITEIINYEEREEIIVTTTPSVSEATEIVISEEIIPVESVITTTTTITTTTVIITKVSRMKVRPEQLVEAGLVDTKSAEILSNPENFKGPQGEELNLKEALAYGKIDGDSGAILELQTQQLLTINEAVTKNVFDKDGNYLLPVGRSLSVPELKSQGLYDPKEQKVIHPETGGSMTISQAIASDVLNPFSPVNDPVSKKRLSLSEAVEKNVVCDETGNIMDPRGEISLLQAVDSGTYDQCKHPLEDNLPPVAMTISGALKRGLADLEKGTMRNPITEEEISIEEAVEKGMVMVIPQQQNPSATPIKTAIEKGLVDLEKGIYTDPKSQNQVPLADAVEAGIVSIPLPPSVRRMSGGSVEAVSGEVTTISPASKPDSTTTTAVVTLKEPVPVVKDTLPKKIVISPESIIEAKPMDLDEVDGKIKNLDTGEEISILEAVENNLLDSSKLLVTDPKTGKEIALETAKKDGTLDVKNVQVKDPTTGKKMSFKEGLKMGLLAVVAAPVLAGAAVIGAPVLAVGAAVDAVKKLSEKKQTSSTPSKEEQEVGQVQASPKAIEIEITSQAKKPLELVEHQAEESIQDVQWLEATEKPYPLQVAVMLGNYSPETGLMRLENSGEFVTLQDAIEQNEIDSNALTCRDPRTGSVISLTEAIDSGLIHPKTGQALDPVTGAELNLDDAIHSGLLVTPTRKTSLPEAIYSGKYDPETNNVKLSDMDESIPLKKAIESQIISVDHCLVKNFATEEIMPFTVAVTNNLIDLDQGTVKTSPTTACSLTQGLESGWLVEVKPPLSLSETILKGLYQPASSLFLNPKSGDHVNLDEALKKKIVDSDSVHVKDTREGFVKKMPLKTAIEEGFVSGEDGSVKDFEKNERVPLLQALESGLIIDSRTPLSLQKAIHLGLYAEETGRITDPNTGNSVTLHEAVRRLIVNPNLPCYWSEDCEKLLSLVETCRIGIIDRQKGLLCVPQVKEQDKPQILSLSDALSQGYIVDIEGAFSLYQALKIGLYDKNTKKFVHPSSGKKLTLEEACKEELIDPETSIIKNLSNSQIMKLPLAITQGLINPLDGVYNVPKDDKLLPLNVAREKGLVLTMERPLSVLDIIRENLYNGESGKIADPILCDWINISEAIKTNLIDPTTTAVQNLKTKQIKSFVAALDDGNVNDNLGMVVDARDGKQLTLDNGAKKNIIISVFRPIKFGEAVKENYIDFKRGTFFDPRTSTVSPFHEAIESELIEAGSAVVREPVSNNFRNLRESIRTGLIDMKKRALVHPQSGKLKPLCIIFEQGTIVFLRESMTFDTARDKNYLDVTNGQFFDPSEEPMTLKEAIDINIIDPNSVVVKDTLKKRLVKFPEGYSLALIDPDKSTIFNTAANYTVPLNVALDTKLVLTPRTPLSLIEALDYSMYNPRTGKFTDPYAPSTAPEISLSEAIANGLIESNTTMVKDPKTGKVIPLENAIAEKIIDGEEGWLTDSAGVRQNLLDAWKNGLLVPKKVLLEARLAIEAQYRNCDNTIINLNDWLQDIERRLGSQETLTETVEELKRQTITVKNIRDEVDDHSQPVNSCLDQVRHLLSIGGDVLSSDEMASLERNGKTLKTRFDRVVDQSEKLLRKVTSASDELRKYKSEVSTFTNWMDKAVRVLEDKERNIANVRSSSNIKEFVSDVIAHQGDLRFISMSAQKFVDKSRDYLQTLNDFRANLPQHLPYLEARESTVTQEVKHLTSMYQDLLNRANRLDGAKSDLENFKRDRQYFNEQLDGLNKWLNDMEDTVAQQKPPSADFNVVKAQLQEQKLLNKMLSDRQPSVTSFFKLGKDVAARAEPAERAEIEGQMRNVGGRYDNLCDGAKDRQKALEIAMKVAKEFADKIGPLSDWLDKTSRKLKDMSRIPSDEDKINRRIKEHDALHEGILKKRPDFNDLLHVASALSQLVGDEEAAQLESSLKDLTDRYGNLVDESEALRQLLRQSKSELRQLALSYEELVKWMNDVDRRLNKHKIVAVHKDKILEQMEQLADLSEEIKDREKQVYDTVEAGLELTKNISNDEALQLKEKMDTLQRRYVDLTKKVTNLLKNVQDALPLVTQFHENHNNLNEWMSDTERLLQSLEGSSVQHQEKEIKILEGEIPEQRKVLDLINMLGPQLCQMSPGEGAAIIDNLVTRDNRRFDSICDQVQRSAERLQNSKTMAIEAQYRNCDNTITNLTDWLQDIEKRLASQDQLMETVDEIKRQAQTVKNLRDEVEDHNRPVAACLDQVRHVLTIGADVLSAEELSSIDKNGKNLKVRYDHVVDHSEKLLRKVNSASDELKKYKTEVSTFKKWMDKAIQILEDKERNITKTSSSGRDNIKEFVSDVIAHQGDLRFISMSAQKFIDKSRDYLQTLNDFRANLPQRLSLMEARESTVAQEVKHLTSMYQDLLNRANRLDGAKADFENFKRDKQFFNDQLDGLNKWLHDMEDTVAHQKPPSADFNVVKAQLQEQKLLNKMISDRQPSVTSLFKLGKDIAARAEPAERAEIEGQMKDVGGRYDNLADGAKDRQKALEIAMKVAKEFADKIGPLSDWLDKTSRKLKDMSLIPSDEDKIQRRIKEHDALHDSILKKQPEFNDLLDIASALTELVGDDEAAKVESQIKDLTDRYGNLVDESERLRQLLRQSKSDLRHLVLSYEELVKWMNEMDKRLSKHKVVAVHKDKLLEQMEQLADLTDEIKDREKQVDDTVEAGLELMKNISNDEALQLKEKLDSLQRRFNDLTKKAADLLKNAQDALPLVTQFHENHNNLSDWMLDAEGLLQSLDGSSLHHQEKEIKILEAEIPEQRKVLDMINLIGPQLCQMSPGEGASTIEGLVTRDNRRFDAICEQVQRRAERIQMAKSRSMEVLSDIDELLDWFREIEGQIKDAEKPSCEPDVVRLQLQEHRALNDEINSQKGRVRDVLATAKKVLREAAHGEDTAILREKADDLKETMESVSKLSSDRLNALEQALPLAEHFFETHSDLNNWMDAMEDEMQVLDTPAIRADQIMKLMDKTQAFLESVNQHKPLVDKLNKTGGALIKLCNNDDAGKVQDIMDNDNDRYNSLKVHLREKQQELDKALQETNRFEDKLDGMLNALESTADQVNNAEPISAHPDKIREQIDENAGIIDDMKKREDAYNAVKNTAADVIAKAPNKNDPAVKEIKNKLDRLNSLWDQIQKATKQRGKNLDAALLLAEKFWEQLQSVMEKLEALQETLKNQDPPAVEPKAIQKQQDDLKVIKKDIDKTKPEVGLCRQTGQNLMKICGEQDKPEIKKNIEDLDSAWDNITALFAKREENLIDAMEKAMEFHDTLQSLLKFLDRAEERLANFDVIGADIDAVKKQIRELKDFKNDVDPMMVKVESLNRQAQELTERTSPEQAAKIKGPLAQVNKRWDNLLKGIVDRQRELENALLRLGQFQHALQELMAWIEKTNKSLDSLKPVFGDPQIIEVELAKLKVLMNDIQAHQNSVDTINDAGRQIIESEKGSENASNTRQKLNDLNRKWDDLQQKANSKHKELEDALREAHLFNQEIQDLLLWLGEVDSAISSSKPTGGLPETAAAELARFMEIYDELEANKPKVEAVLQQGQQYLKKSTEGAATNLAHNLRTLKQRWESVLNRANDKKIKLEIALKEANEFHKAVQDFIEWLTEAERYLAGLEPVSRVLPKVLDQVESHKEFQKEIAAHREVMVNLDKKGNHLKYFSQKQDVILIKNLLISVQHRWDRVVSKSTERTRALDLGLKEAKEFHDAWTSLCKWLDDAEISLDEMSATAGNNPVKIKQMLAKHKEFQKLLSAKQPVYDNTMKMGKNLKDKAPKTDEPILRQMLTDLKNKWNSVCNKSVERQRNLEEALLRSGQFKDALQELLDWLKQVDALLVEDGPVHGDLDTVLALIEQHKKIEDELQNRRSQMNDVVRTAEEMMDSASPEERERLRAHVKEIKTFFDRIKAKCDDRSIRLEQALKEAEKLHKSVHMLLEWLSDAEMKLRFAGSLPEDEEGTRRLLEEQEKFMRELMIKEREKDDTIDLAKSILAKAHPDAVNVIKHWISIIQSRWDEISSWAKQRGEKLTAHLASLRDMEDLLEELMNWLQRCEDNLTHLEAEPLPDDLGEIQILIKEHKEFMEGMAKRQPEIDSVCKPKLITRQPAGKGKPGGRLRSTTPGSRETSPELDLAQRRISKQIGTPSRESPMSRLESPGREKSPELFPHIGPRFDRRGSKAIEPQIKNPRVKALWDKWKHVWMMAWERQRRLQDKYNYLLELEKVKNFSWEDWRKRFLKFMNHKKSRVTDLFRKIDRNNNGLIPREEFIDAIMKTKFPTSRLEMNAVADMFDHGDHLIDYMEFIAALRPDWEEKKPVSEADIVDDEIQRQVMKCTCRQKFRVFQVGEGKYRFGDSQKLRLVRILRSTVMVRVGGGWVALDEFLVKNDPCRAKGRTNIELREQFILADGVSQTMTAFKSKASGSTISSQSGNRSAQSLPAAGPITKVKERSIRSVPMGRARSTDRTTPDSTFSDDGFSLSRLPRKSSGGPGRGSTPGSRPGSKPPSRAGSNASLDSTDDHGSRIPRRTGSLKRGTTSGLRQPLATSTPVSSRAPFSLNTNVSTNGASARGRSPSGASSERALSFTRPSSAQSAARQMQRTGSASSLSSMTNFGSRPSRIPVFVGGDSLDLSNRSRTPSNSNIPVAVSSSHSLSTPRARTPSGSNVTFAPGTTATLGGTTSTSSATRSSASKTQSRSGTDE